MVDTIPEELLSVLACPVCKQKLELKDGKLLCHHCEKEFLIKDGIPVFC